MQKLFLLLSFLLICIKAAAQTNLYVDANVAASGAGTTWATAYKTLNEALNVANAGSTATKYDIHIATGDYYPTGAQSSTNRDSTFLIARAGIKLYGGYPSGGGARWRYNYTFLSGNIGSRSTMSDNSYHVMVIAGIAATTDTVLIDRLYIVDGNATGSLGKTYNAIPVSQGNAGGIMIKNNACSLQVDSCYFITNISSGSGGAIQNENAPTHFTNCGFEANKAAGSGGAIYINSDSNTAPVVISNTGFSLNSSTNASGGAIYNTRTNGAGAGTIIANCSFGGGSIANSQNTASVYGGAICDNSQNCAATSITNCSFSGNWATYGGAIAGNNATVSAGSNYIKNCSFSANTAAVWGGAISNNAVNFAFTIDSCLFDRNRAGAGGGGGLSNVSTGTTVASNVSHCWFNNDSAAIGGGVYNYGAVNFSNTRFTLNKAVQGAGLYNLNPGSSIIRNDTFSGNVAAQYGAGLCNMNSSSGFTISNSLFSGNKAGSGGGGMYDSAASPNITNCTFAGDTASAGNGIYNNASSPVILNSITWEGGNGILNTNGSTPTITYSTVQGGYAGTGNLASNPLFIAPVPASFAPTTAGNYELIPCSPQVDAGINTGSYSGVTDLAGNPRLYGIRVDQGAYEYSGGGFPAPVTGNSTVCTNNSIPLSNIQSGGNWASSNPLIATVNASGLVTGVSVGVDTITYSVSNGSCSGTAMKVITVTAAPVVAAITGKDSVCVNSSITVSNTTGGGTWMSSNPLIASVSGNTVTGRTPGMATITYTVTAGVGCATSVTKNITVLALPVIAPIVGKSTICIYAADSFTSATPGGVWTSMDTNIANIHPVTGVIIGLAKGQAIIRYTVSNAYCSSIVGKQVSVEVIDTSVTNYGDRLYATEPGVGYQWLDCNNGHSLIPGEEGQVFYPQGNGAYAVIVTKNGCSDTSACHTIMGLSVPGINGHHDRIKVYPNPASGMLTVETGDIRPDYLIMRDVAGKELQRVVPAGNNVNINLATYAPGIYLIEIYDGVERYTARVSVVR